MKRRRRKAPASTLRADLGRRMRDKDGWSGGSFDDYDAGERSARPFFLVTLLRQMHRFLLIKAAVAVAVVLVAAILHGGNHAWGRPVVEALQFVASWDMDLDFLTGRVAPAFRTVWNNWGPSITGEENNGTEATEKIALPLDGRLVSAYGLRLDPRSDREEMHYGVDLSAPEGSPVLAVMDGVVFKVEESGGVVTVILNHNFSWQTFYRGLSASAVAAGETVQAGTKLGPLGSASLYDLPHLHFEIRYGGRPVEPPAHWLEQFREPVV